MEAPGFWDDAEKAQKYVLELNALKSDITKFSDLHSEYEDLMYEPGVQNMIRGGYIKVDGVQEERAVIETPTNVMEKDEIVKMIEDKDITAFAKYIQIAPSAAKDTIVQYVVDHNITDNAFTALIKKYCGVDVIQAIAVKHQAEER